MQRKQKIVIIGGGSAGWFTAAYLSRYLGHLLSITVIETPKIPTISVGESVTPHVQLFFDELGIPTHEWMRETGAIYKMANKFQGWVTGDSDEVEYFSFNFPFDVKQLYKENSDLITFEKGYNIDPGSFKTSDIIAHLYNNKTINKFDRFFNSQYHYMTKNVAPFKENEYLLNQKHTWSQHINSDRCGSYVRDNLCKPNGVRHLQKKVVKVMGHGDRISSVELEDGSKESADIFVDASGFHKVLVKHLEWKEKIYEDYAIDRAVVGHSSYADPQTEMVNHTQTIAQPYGWMFKIGLYHRMGNGFCYSSSHMSDEDAVAHFKKITKNIRSEPRILKWTPSRQETFASGNVATIGLSSGFYEPLEANSLFVLIAGIKCLTETIKNFQETNVLDWLNYNEKLSYALDDIADFIRVHYTLSKRTDTDFWNDMRAIGERRNDADLLRQKYYDDKNTITNAEDNWSMFPDYMWLQVAISWGIDVSHWFKEKVPNDVLDIGSCYFLNRDRKHDVVSNYLDNNYDWLKQNVYKNVSPGTWEIDNYGINFDSKKSQ